MLDDVTTKRFVWNTILFLVFSLGMAYMPLWETDHPYVWILMTITMVVVLGVLIGELLVRWKAVYKEHKKQKESNNPILKKI